MFDLCLGTNVLKGFYPLLNEYLHSYRQNVFVLSLQNNLLEFQASSIHLLHIHMYLKDSQK